MATAVDVELTDGERESQVASDRAGAPTGRLATQVTHRIEAAVMSRGWPVGESLGSEPELRRQFGVSMSVLREAVRLVEHHRVARMRRGPGGGLIISARTPVRPPGRPHPLVALTRPAPTIRPC